MLIFGNMQRAFEEKRIKNSFILLSFFLLAVSILFTVFLFRKDLSSIHKKIFKEYEEVYVEKSKSEIKNVVDYFVDSIDFERKHLIEDTYLDMKKDLSLISTALNKADKENLNPRELFKVITYTDNSVVIVNSDGIVLYGRFFKPGTNIAKIKDKYGYNFFEIIENQIRSRRSSNEMPADFYRLKNITYMIAAKFLPKYKIYILKIRNLSELEQKLKNKFKMEIDNFRYGISKKRYVFVIRLQKIKNGKFEVIRVVNPNRPKSMMNKEIPLDIKDVKGKEFLKEMVKIATTKGSGFVEYYFKIIGENRIAPKISYIKYYKPWHWIVGSGFYPDLYKADLLKKDKSLGKFLKGYMINLTVELILLNLILFVVLVVFAQAIMKRIAKYRSKLEEKERFHTHLIESIPNPLYIINGEGEFINVNEAFEKFFCVTKKRILEKNKNDYAIEKVRNYAMEFFRGTRASSVLEMVINTCKSKRSIIEIHYSKYMNNKGESEGVIGVIFDITMKKIRESKLKKISIKDELTGLFNRRYFNEVLNREIIRANRYKEPLSIIMYDIDHFKRVNDTYGHLVGDKVLKSLSEIVRKSVRDSDYVFRIGGEEFAILLTNTGLEGASRVAEKLRKKVENYDFGEVGRITISLGVTQYKYKESMEDFMDRVDRALYESKNSGRNRITRV